MDARGAEQPGADQQALEPRADELGGDAWIEDRAGAHRAWRTGLDRRFEQRATRVDVARLALARIDVLVVDRDDAVLAVDHVVQLGLVDDLHERGQAVLQGELDQVLEGLDRQDLGREQDGRGTHVPGCDDLPLAGDEVLLEQRQVGQPLHLAQHLVVAAEPAAGDDRDARRPGGDVLLDDLGDRPLAHQLGALAVLALDLHDDRQSPGQQALNENARHRFSSWAGPFQARLIVSTFSAPIFPSTPRALVSTSTPRNNGCAASFSYASRLSAEIPPASRNGRDSRSTSEATTPAS